MSEFTPITTQEDLNRIIADRIGRVEKQQAEKFAGYISPDELKAQTDSLTAQVAELSSSFKEATEQAAAKASEDAKTIADLESKVHSYETASVKSRIAHEYGLPFELANKLAGDDEESIRQDAETFKAIIAGLKTPTPHVSNPNESGGATSKQAALLKMSADLR